MWDRRPSYCGGASKERILFDNTYNAQHTGNLYQPAHSLYLSLHSVYCLQSIYTFYVIDVHVVFLKTHIHKVSYEVIKVPDHNITSCEKQRSVSCYLST